MRSVLDVPKGGIERLYWITEVVFIRAWDGPEKHNFFFRLSCCFKHKMSLWPICLYRLSMYSCKVKFC